MNSTIRFVLLKIIAKDPSVESVEIHEDKTVTIKYKENWFSNWAVRAALSLLAQMVICGLFSYAFVKWML